MTESTDPLKHNGEVRTELDCHNCSRDFIALIDYSVDGNHVIECPWCGHEHCRVITGGKVTGDRWEGRNHDTGSTPKVTPRRVWRSQSVPAQSCSRSHFLRDRWLNRSQ